MVTRTTSCLAVLKTKLPLVLLDGGWEASACMFMGVVVKEEAGGGERTPSAGVGGCSLPSG